MKQAFTLFQGIGPSETINRLFQKILNMMIFSIEKNGEAQAKAKGNSFRVCSMEESSVRILFPPYTLKSKCSNHSQGIGNMFW